LQKQQRVYIYAFLSTLFGDYLSEKQIEDLKANKELLETLSPEALHWFETNDTQEIKEALNSDYSSLFIMNSQPIESSILDNKAEVQVGLQNPVMQFYFSCGYELNLANSKLNAPDHISLEFGFMQNLVQKDERELQISFLQNHLLKWAPIYLLGIKDMAKTPFYRGLCEFCTEFLLADYEHLMSKNGND
jgi:TorA maturation chaperone TorD